MGLLRAIVAVFTTAISGMAVGGFLGAAIGKMMPTYYESVFSHGGEPGFDAGAVGIGQGLTQGLAFGAVIGLAVVAMEHWKEIKIAKYVAEQTRVNIYGAEDEDVMPELLRQ